MVQNLFKKIINYILILNKELSLILNVINGLTIMISVSIFIFSRIKATKYIFKYN